MSDLAQVIDLINDIYGAALDSRLWPQALRRATSLLEGAPAETFADSDPPAGRLYRSVDVDPRFADPSVRHYVRLNPPIRQEPPVPADDRARELMRLLAPHFRRAAAIGKALERSESRATALGEVLDRLSTAVVFVDAAGRLVHANAAAERRLADGDALSWSGGKPRPCSEDAAAHLQAILASASRGPAAPGSCSCALSIAQATRAGARVCVHILPLAAGGHRHALAAGAAAAAIVVARCDADLVQRIESAARLYEFTPAESRVVQALLAGCTIGRVASLLGIAEATVKTHLQHVFDKTGTRRQVDLARLIVERP